MILDGKKIRNRLLEDYKRQIREENLKLTLAILLVGDNKESMVYINNKLKYCDYVGIKTKFIKLDSNILEDEVINIIEDLNNDDSITGIILQSPVPKHINFENCIRKIDYKKDVDGFTKDSLFSLVYNKNGLRPCTPKGIIKLLEEYNISLKGKKVCIIGRGNIVGKPLIFEFLNKDATVIILHSKSINIKEETLKADIVVACAGVPNLVTSDMIKDNAIVIDVGITVVDNKIHGDVDFEKVKQKASYITPNPGGVGPMTIAMIIENIINAGRMK